MFYPPTRKPIPIQAFSICLLFNILLFALTPTSSLAQNTRINDYNSIGWYNYFGTIKLSSKWGVHHEYQFRRDDFISKWQQSLLRLGINYQIHPKIQFRLGYAWIETFPYGDFPINSMGKDFTEHRIYQMVTLTDKVSILDFSHRFMLEQRFIGIYTNANLSKEDKYTFLNRLRYLFRIQLPLIGKEVGNKTPYLAFYDEIFIGFGKNVKENVFDQNRVSLLVGYRFSPVIRLECGYLNQTLQLGREIENRNVFQYNNGIIVNLYLNLDFSKKESQ